MDTEDTYRLLRGLVEELARCGMTDAVTCPGSRNTPVLLTLAREPEIRAWSHVDERAGGFFALGAAKASGRPVAVTCTSGTAVANLLPAVVEAWWGRVPLILLTADRPAQLRDVGAGQAIDQIKLFGDHVKWFAEVELPPELDAGAMRWARQLACRAYATAVDGRPGPVHLNLPLREPLGLRAPLAPETSLPGRSDGRPWLVSPTPPDRRPAPPELRLAPGTVLVAGGPDRGWGAELAQIAAARGLPLLADPLSGARRGAAAIAHYDLLLRAPEALPAPELVVRVGDLPTSKPLRGWLAGLPADVPQIAIDPEGAWQDPDGALHEVCVADPPAVLRAAPGTGDPELLARWRAADAAAATAIAATLGDTLSEPAVARTLGAGLPGNATLYVASSMPIRDVEAFVAIRPDPPRVLANRGANGIDGTVSAAFGAAAVAGAGEPVVLLIGDLALLHDLGGLLAAARHDLALTIVLLDNDGGGIFHFLPVSAEGADFTEHVATPHGLGFAAAAALFRTGHVAVATPAELTAALAESLEAPGTTLIEVRTDRTENRALHETVAAAVRTAVGG